MAACTASAAAPIPERAADATAGQPSEKLEDSQAMTRVKSEPAATAMDADMAEVAPAEPEAVADEKPEVASEPVTIGFRTFASGTDCCDYFRGLLTKLSHEQDLNEVGAERATQLHSHETALVASMEEHPTAAEQCP